jgi:hypothetical protein
MWDWFARFNLPQIKGRAYFFKKLFWTGVPPGLSAATKKGGNQHDHPRKAYQKKTEFTIVS